MNTFKEAETKLGNRVSRKLENNTYLQRREKGIAVLLHETDVVTYLPDGSCVLNSGGWKTVTTKDRMNSYAPCRIYSDKGVWYVSDGRWDSEKRQPYGDGFRIGPRGGFHVPVGFSVLKTQALRKRIRDFAKAFETAFKAGEVPLPSGGDCWFCALGSEDGKPMGDRQADHYLSHMDDNYYVPALLFNAMKSRGMGDAYFWDWGAIVEGKKPFISWGWVSKTVARYLYLQLGV